MPKRKHNKGLSRTKVLYELPADMVEAARNYTAPLKCSLCEGNDLMPTDKVYVHMTKANDVVTPKTLCMTCNEERSGQLYDASDKVFVPYCSYSGVKNFIRALPGSGVLTGSIKKANKAADKDSDIDDDAESNESPGLNEEQQEFVNLFTRSQKPAEGAQNATKPLNDGAQIQHVIEHLKGCASQSGLTSQKAVGTAAIFARIGEIIEKLQEKFNALEFEQQNGFLRENGLPPRKSKATNVLLKDPEIATVAGIGGGTSSGWRGERIRAAKWLHNFLKTFEPETRPLISERIIWSDALFRKVAVKSSLKLIEIPYFLDEIVKKVKLWDNGEFGKRLILTETKAQKKNGNAGGSEERVNEEDDASDDGSEEQTSDGSDAGEEDDNDEADNEHAKDHENGLHRSESENSSQSSTKIRLKISTDGAYEHPKKRQKVP